MTGKTNTTLPSIANRVFATAAFAVFYYYIMAFLQVNRSLTMGDLAIHQFDPSGARDALIGMNLNTRVFDSAELGTNVVLLAALAVIWFTPIRNLYKQIVGAAKASRIRGQ